MIYESAKEMEKVAQKKKGKKMRSVKTRKGERGTKENERVVGRTAGEGKRRRMGQGEGCWRPERKENRNGTRKRI